MVNLSHLNISIVNNTIGSEMMNNNSEIQLPNELLELFAKALVPEIKMFYASDEGKEYYEKWCLEHRKEDE